MQFLEALDADAVAGAGEGCDDGVDIFGHLVKGKLSGSVGAWFPAHAHAEQPKGPTGDFGFNLWQIFDVRPGHLVTVTDGVNTKSHTVTNLVVDGVDVAADTVSGRADPGTTVDVWVHDVPDGGTTITADSSGNWIADFSAITDLTYASNGASHQLDSDGDSTIAWWSAPTFQVAPVDDWVQSSGGWTPGTTISLTIEDGGGVVHTDTQTTDPSGHFFFNLWETFDLQRGHVVTVSDEGGHGIARGQLGGDRSRRTPCRSAGPRVRGRRSVAPPGCRGCEA